MSTRNYHAVVRGQHTYGRIVVGLDGSEGSKDALRWAARQAELTGDSLDVVMTWEVPVVPYGVWAGYDAGAEAKETLDATSRRSSAASIRPRRGHSYGRPARVGAFGGSQEGRPSGRWQPGPRAVCLVCSSGR